MIRRLTAICRSTFVAVGVAILAGGAARAEVKIRFVACVDFLSEGNCVSGEFKGDKIQTTGSGFFTLDEKGGGDVQGDGTFIHRDKTGKVIAKGRWRARNFLGYRTYGCAGCPAGLPAGSEGGNLLIAAELVPDGGEETNAIIEINCDLGTIPPNKLYDGVEVRVAGLRFDQAQDGLTLFIRQ